MSTSFYLLLFKPCSKFPQNLKKGIDIFLRTISAYGGSRFTGALAVIQAMHTAKLFSDRCRIEMCVAQIACHLPHDQTFFFQLGYQLAHSAVCPVVVSCQLRNGNPRLIINLRCGVRFYHGDRRAVAIILAFSAVRIVENNEAV